MPGEVGLECKFYVNSGTYGAPVWGAADSIREATMPLDKAVADLSARTSTIRTQKSTLKEIPIEFTLVRQNTTAAKATWKTFFDAWWSNDTVDILMLDGTVSDVGSSGVRGEFEVQSFSRGEPLEDAVTAAVKIFPRITDNGAPVKYEVT